MIDWTAFTPRSSAAGGLLIGLASALLLLLNGRIAGISGIVGGLLDRRREDRWWRIAFLGGLIGAPIVYRLMAPLPSVHIDVGVPTLVVAGLLVGIGTRYGSGCTSGHGVCGLSRLSTRSLVATLVFIAAGVMTVFVVRHFLQ